MFDIRTALGLETITDEFNSFSAMLDQRKQEHIHWVEELERSAYAGEPFKLSHDPHGCAFGKWYDSFQSDNHLINAHLKKIDEPHQNLHHMATEVEDCLLIEDPAERDRQVKGRLRQLRENLMPTILQLLDETKGVFRSSMFREMVLILSDARIGLVADEILMVDHLLPVQEEDNLAALCKSPYVLNIRRSPKMSEIIFELNVPYILNDCTHLIASSQPDARQPV